MADEISISATITCVNGGSSLPTAAVTKKLDQAGNDQASLTQTLTATTWEVINCGDIDTASGYGVCVESLEAKGGDYVEFAYDDSGTKRIGQAMPSAGWTMVWPTAPLYARAHTTDHHVRIKAFEL